MSAVKLAARLGVSSGVRLVLPTAIANGLVTIGAALGGVVIARALGPEGRGTVAAIMAWFVVVQVVSEGGVQGSTAFHAARIHTDRRTLIGTTSTLLGVQAVAVGGAALCLAWWLGSPRDFFFGFAVVVVGLIPVLWLSASLFALQGIRIGAWNAARATQVPVYVGLLTALWFSGRMTASSASLAVVLSNLLAGFVAFLLARSLVSKMTSGNDRVSLRRIYRFALPNLAWTLPGIVSGRLDQLSLSLLVPLEDLGQYAVAISLTGLSVPIVSSIGNVLMPLLSRQASEGETPGSRGYKAVAWAATFAGAVTACTALTAPWVVPVLFGPGFDEVPRLTWLLVPATILHATNWVAADVLRGMARPGAAARAQWAALLTNLIAVPLAVKVADTGGAALAPVLGFSVALLILLKSLARCSGDGRSMS